MTLENIKSLIPDYAKDQRVNLDNVLKAENLSEEQVMMVALASAFTIGQADILKNIDTMATDLLDEAHIQAAKTAAALMGMNNIYYRFLHLSKYAEFMQLPARLRMQGLQGHGIDQGDFELMAQAVSAINGCGMCIESHNAALLKHDFSKVQIQDAVRIGAVLKAVADIVEAEKTLNT